MTRQKLLIILRKYANKGSLPVLYRVLDNCKDQEEYLSAILRSGIFHYPKKGEGIRHKISNKVITTFSTEELLKLL